MDPSKPISKRGAFQPRGDLQNRSPEDEEDCDEILKNSEPLHHNDTATKKKKAKYLTVKSSGYGRASQSVKLSVSSNSSRPKLRHGDGSLAGELVRDKQRSRKSTLRASLPSNTTTAAKRSNNNRVKSLSRSTSPAVKNLSDGGLNQNKRHHDGNKSDATKRQKKQEASSNHLLDSKTEAAPANSFHSPRVQSPVAGSYSQSIDVDPTPVKAAKQLLSDARKKAVMEPTPLSPLVLSPVVEEKADSSQVVKADNNMQTSSLTEQKSNENTNSVDGPIASIFADLHPNISQTQSLSDNLFSVQSGIASTSILSLIKNKAKVTSSTVDRSTPSELRKRLERREEELKTLKIVCKDLLQGKDEYVAGAIGIEYALREKIMSVHSSFGLMEEEKMNMIEQLKDATDEAVKLQEEVSRLQSERDLMTDKCNTLQNDCNVAKSNLQTMQQSHTDDCVKIALLESKVKECNSQLEEARSQVEDAKISIERAMDEARNEVSNEINVYKETNDALVASAKAREMEVCRIMGVDLGSVDFDDESSFLNAIQSKVDEYNHNTNTSIELQNEVELLRAELKQAKTDIDNALDRGATKDKDISELMRNINDMQRTAQDREKEFHLMRKDAEDRALESEKKLLSLNVEKESLEKTLDETKAGNAKSESTVQELNAQLSEAKIGFAQLTSQLQLEKDMRAKCEAKEAEERNERVAVSAQLLAMTKEHSKAETQLRDDIEKLEESWINKHNAAVEESKTKDEKLNDYREEISSLKVERVSLKQALSEQKTVLDASREEEIGRLKGEITVLQERLKSEVEHFQNDGAVNAQRVRELEENIRKSEVERKRMFNIIQELRGNVRVFARIRPFLPRETDDHSSVSPTGETTLEVDRGGQQSSFQFDRVFAQSAGQEAVFDEVSEFVQSALDGYNVCLFSYGQTGSGKTHTLQGTGSGAMRGLIPRSIEQIGLHKKKLEQEGWEYAMDVSFLEIYNETIRDLLRDTKSDERKHDIKVDNEGRRTVTNLIVKQVDPNDSECCDALLSLAAKRRATASTDMNDVSSRSHSVFTLNLTAKHEEKNKLIRGTLHLVDLAGSERLNRSNATGQAAKEAMAINKSLSSLTDVFAAIGEKSRHIPFRNSKLTYLLQPCFSGDGKTLMIVNISPTADSVQESMCSLRFASHVNKCELGKAKRTCTKMR